MLPHLLSAPASTRVSVFSLLYGDGPGVHAAQMQRYKSVVKQFEQVFGEAPHYIFSSPGRCEIGGNHTDHNGGQVLAAAIHLDVVAAISPANDYTLTVYSAGFDRPFVVELAGLDPNQAEHPTSQLLRGIAAGFVRRGYRVGGLHVALNSTVLFASGLSSSAALEVLFAAALNQIYNDSAVGVHELAEIGREAEHLYWQKPVGLLDQLTICLGGLVHISFEQSASPRVGTVACSLEDSGYQMVLVNPGGDHAALTSEYKQIPAEMQRVAHFFGKARLIETTLADVLSHTAAIRADAGDRAVLRAIHFFKENERVEQEVQAINNRNIQRFLRLVKSSGDSSWRLLQNCYEPAYPSIQPISLALATTEVHLQPIEADVGYRVHGGGFGGTILVIVPTEALGGYQAQMEKVFGIGSCQSLRIRPVGCVDVRALERDLDVVTHSLPPTL